MRLEAFLAARDAAHRFIQTCRAVQTMTMVPDHGKPYDKVVEGTKESAACKRASLDLTRALSELRRP